MSKDVQIVEDRIKNGLCPICGRKIPLGQSILVVDARFGDVFVCSNHIVQGENKLREGGWIMALLLIVVLAWILGFCVTWLMTKGTIWVMGSLFNVDWSHKFWAVFVLILLIGMIFGPVRKTWKSR